MDQLNIYIDRLRDDEPDILNESIDAQFFDIEENELKLEDQVHITGSAFRAKEHLIVELKIQASISLPCAVCNQAFPLLLEIGTFNHAISLSKIRGAIYSLKDEIRTAILLKVPLFSECHDGACPKRPEVKKFFKQDTHLPFSELC